MYPCTKRTVVYENICLLCHPGAEAKVCKLNEECTAQAVYVGESCRSLYERGREHQSDFQNGEEKSHMLKHHVLVHGGKGDPRFHMRPVKYPILYNPYIHG